MDCYRHLIFPTGEAPGNWPLIMATQLHPADYILRRSLLDSDHIAFLAQFVLPNENFTYITGWSLQVKDSMDKDYRTTTFGFLLFHAHTIEALVLLVRANFYSPKDSTGLCQFLKTWKTAEGIPRLEEVAVYMRNFALQKHKEYSGFLPMRFCRAQTVSGGEDDWNAWGGLQIPSVPICPTARPKNRTQYA